jgi:hypothetical protein
MDIGFDNEQGLEAVVNYLRNEPEFTKKALKLRKMTFKDFIRSRKTLNEANKYGFCSLDLLNENVSWDTLRTKYSMTDIIQFGVNFQVATKIGLLPKYFGGDAGLEVLRKMSATDEDIKSVIKNLLDIKETAWSPVTVAKAGFTFQELCALGNVAQDMQNTSWDIKQIVLAFHPNQEDWTKAGFSAATEGWDKKQLEQFVFPSLQSTPNVAETGAGKAMDLKKEAVGDDYILHIDESKINFVKF